MASNVQTHANEEETSNSNSTRTFRLTSRRTPSFSSLSPSNSWDSSNGSSSFSLKNEEHYPTFSPTTPLRFKGIPFSWEKIPGIPKHQLGSKKKEYSEHLLPLPPAGNSNPAAKKSTHHQEEINNRFQKDPFFAALVECSKDDRIRGTIWKDNNSKNIATRSLSDRFGFINLYTSCKRTCTVSEPTVYIRPRPSPR